MASETFYPAVSGDDGYWASAFNNTNDYLWLGDFGADSYNVFVRFTNVTIPQGAMITGAFIRFTSQANTSGGTPNVRIRLNAVDNSTAPINVTSANTLSLTTAYVDWIFSNSWTDGATYDTVAFISVLQEIIDRVGWSSNNALTVLLHENGGTSDYYRWASSVDFVSGVEKPEFHVTWELPPPEVTFTFTNPIPVHLSTAYGTDKQLQLTTTVSGEEENYTYDTTFYDGSDVQIGTTVLGVNSGSSATSNAYLSTPSGVDYNWYVVATSSGSEDTSSTYTFSNRFLYEGYITENSDPVTRTVRLYNRDTGELSDSTTSSGSNGYYSLDATVNDEHFIVAFDDEAGEDYNALVLDRLLPNGE